MLILKFYKVTFILPIYFNLFSSSANAIIIIVSTHECALFYGFIISFFGWSIFKYSVCSLPCRWWIKWLQRAWMRTWVHAHYSLSPSSCGSSTLEQTAERLSFHPPQTLCSWGRDIGRICVSLLSDEIYKTRKSIRYKKKKIQRVNVSSSHKYSATC